MIKQRRFGIPLLVAGVLVVAACTCAPDGLLDQVLEPTVEPTATTGAVSGPAFRTGDMGALISKQGGGEVCADNVDFTCIAMDVPFDPFDSANTRTISLTFAIHQATGERKGMIVMAYPGGPGGEGVSTGTLDKFADGVQEAFDIVYFDQRGVGLSSPLECPNAISKSFEKSLQWIDTEGEEGYDTPEEQQEAIADSREFVDECLAEMGIDQAELKFYATKYVAEDLEAFRAAVGDEKFYLYGVSYGTAVSQTYAASHADHLAGMFLDGTTDLTVDGITGAHTQERAFDTVLVAALEQCNKDSSCNDAMGGDDALQVYDDFAVKLADSPVDYTLQLPDGSSVTHQMTFGKLEGAAAFMMYSRATRMLFMKSLAQAHATGDFSLMARYFYAVQNYDPATEKYVGDPTFSYSDYYVVNCADNNYFTGTPDERIQKTFEEGQASNGTVPRLDGNVYIGVTCALWPSSPSEESVAEPLAAAGVPTFVLNATLDPATPFEEGKAVFERLDNGYHLYVEGGEHGIFGGDESCPDDIITDFLLYDKQPSDREIECEWDDPVMWGYIPPIPENVSEFNSLLQAFVWTTFEILLSPEYGFAHQHKSGSMVCPKGGTFDFVNDGKTGTFTFNECSYSNGLILSGTGTYNGDSSEYQFNVNVSGDEDGELTFTFNGETGDSSLTGTYGGDQIDLSQ
jgi:pimeloyl-ACP methyl ester carboxylesterase